MYTSETLVRAIKFNSFEELTSAALIDYGFTKLNEYWQNVLFNLYADLVKHKNIDAQYLHKCYLANKLDELIHIKYRYWRSDYYIDFLENKIIIGKTRMLDFRDPETNALIDNFYILDDSYCLLCEKSYMDQMNKLYENNEGCSNCNKKVCVDCRYYYNIDFYKCLQCIIMENTQKITNNIVYKLKLCKQRERNNFKYEGNIEVKDIKDLLWLQNNQCYVCHDILVKDNYMPNCCYQFEITKINEHKPYDRNNVLISCLYCWKRYHPNFNGKYKVCVGECHEKPRYNLPRMGDVLQDKKYIDALKLN
jgi:hypothetical protein